MRFWKLRADGHRLPNREKAGFARGEQKKIRATVAKEVGMKNPAEETTVRPNQNQNHAETESIQSSLPTHSV